MPEWISVKNKLPPDDTVVLAWSILDNSYALAAIRNNNWYCVVLYTIDYHTKDGITHWMPLPERPINE